MNSYTRQLAEFASQLKLTDIPPEVIARAKQVILDTFGCAMFGSDVQWTQIMAAVIRRMEPAGGKATIWGRAETASPVNATLLNGTMVQSYELDDGHPAGSVHSGASVIPAVIAAAEYHDARDVTGEQLLVAIIAAFEVGSRVGLCMNGEKMTVRGWHAPGIVASFPAAIGAGVVLRLDAGRLFHALGIAGTQAGGLMAALFGSMVKRMQIAKAGQSGLYAALLAAEGFTGIENIFEQEYGGYCTTFTQSKDDFDLAALTDGLGSRWETMRIGFKKYACRGGIQTAVYAVEQLMNETGLKAEDVVEIRVGMTEANVKKSVWHPYVPKGLTSAQYHLGFCLATQLIEGRVFVDEMVEANIGRPDLVQLANRIHGFRSLEREQRGPNFRRGADVAVKLTDGRTLQKTVEDRPGSERLPLTGEEMSQKFRTLAAKVLSPQQIAELESIVQGLERATSMTPLIKVLQAQ